MSSNTAANASFPNLTDHNHLKWSVGGREWGTRENVDEAFVASVGKVERQPMSWSIEFQLALERLVDEHGTKLALFYSGGADSELVLRGLVGMGVIPEVHVILFRDHENAEETNHATSFCDQIGIGYTAWNHDVESYVNSQRYLGLGLKYGCTQIAYITVMEYAQRVDLPVLMGGEIYIQRHPKATLGTHTPDEWYYVYREDEDGSTYRYTKATGHPIINEVFSYTPEVMAAWINARMIRDVVTGRSPHKLSLVSSKNTAFENELGTELHAGKKLHGYESLMWTNQWVRRQLASMQLPMQVSKRPLDLFMSDLGVQFKG